MQTREDFDGNTKEKDYCADEGRAEEQFTSRSVGSVAPMEDVTDLSPEDGGSSCGGNCGRRRKLRAAVTTAGDG